MREILFRGKRLDNGEWVEGSLRVEHFLGTKEIHEWWRCSIYVPEDGRPWHCNIYDVDPETVGQYTGQKDRTGKKIFEGDIVRAETYHDYGQYGEKGEARYTVKWCEKRAMFYPFNIVDGDYLRLETFEVIGNIYDNPELIGGTNAGPGGDHAGADESVTDMLSETADNSTDQRGGKP